VVVLAHHPLQSGGPHGGHEVAKDGRDREALARILE
jgi:hypothetical protein